MDVNESIKYLPRLLNTINGEYVAKVHGGLVKSETFNAYLSLRQLRNNQSSGKLLFTSDTSSNIFPVGDLQLNDNDSSHAILSHQHLKQFLQFAEKSILTIDNSITHEMLNMPHISAAINATNRQSFQSRLNLLSKNEQKLNISKSTFLESIPTSLWKDPRFLLAARTEMLLSSMVSVPGMLYKDFVILNNNLKSKQQGSISLSYLLHQSLWSTVFSLNSQSKGKKSMGGAFCFECGATVCDLEALNDGSSEFSFDKSSTSHKKKKLKQCIACNPSRNSVGVVEMQLIASNPHLATVDEFAVHLSLGNGHSLLMSDLRFPLKSFRRYAGAEYRALSSYEMKMQGIRVLVEGYRMIPNLLAMHFASVLYGAVQHFRNLQKDADNCIDECDSDETISNSSNEINKPLSDVTIIGRDPTLTLQFSESNLTSKSISNHTSHYHGIDDYMDCYHHSFWTNATTMPATSKSTGQQFLKDDGSVASNQTTSSSRSMPLSTGKVEFNIGGQSLRHSFIDYTSLEDSTSTINGTINYCLLHSSDIFTKYVDTQFPQCLQTYGQANVLTMLELKRSNEEIYESFTPKLLFQSIGDCNFPSERELRLVSVNINLGPGHVEWFAIPIETRTSYEVMKINMQEKVSKMLSIRDKYFADMKKQIDIKSGRKNSMTSHGIDRCWVSGFDPKYGSIRYGIQQPGETVVMDGSVFYCSHSLSMSRTIRWCVLPKISSKNTIWKAMNNQSSAIKNFKVSDINQPSSSSNRPSTASLSPLVSKYRNSLSFATFGPMLHGPLPLLLLTSVCLESVIHSITPSKIVHRGMMGNVSSIGLKMAFDRDRKYEAKNSSTSMILDRSAIFKTPKSSELDSKFLRLVEMLLFMKRQLYRSDLLMDLAIVGVGLSPQPMPTQRSVGVCSNQLCGVELHTGCFEFPVVGLICLSCGIRLYCGRLTGVRRPLPPPLLSSSCIGNNIPLSTKSVSNTHNNEHHRYLCTHPLYFHDDDDDHEFFTTTETQASDTEIVIRDPSVFLWLVEGSEKLRSTFDSAMTMISKTQHRHSLQNLKPSLKKQFFDIESEEQRQLRRLAIECDLITSTRK